VGVNVSSPAIAGGRLFVNAQDPLFGLAAVNAEDGSLVWKSQRPGESLATLTVANGVVYDLTEQGTLLPFESETGIILGEISDLGGRPFNSGPGAQPAVVDGAVYVTTADLLGRVDLFPLLQPNPAIHVTLTSEGVSLRLENLHPGTSYGLESSVDLKAWTQLERFTATKLSEVWGPTPNSRSATFFRLR
jgi:hypothetical protein